MSQICPKNAFQGNAPHGTGNSAFIMLKGWQPTPAMAFNDTDIKFDIGKHHFCVDSGCTRHICVTKELFSVLKLFTEKEQKPLVKVAKQEFVSAVGIGEVHFSVCNNYGKLHNITLKDVLFIPNASVNLLSTEKLEKLIRSQSGRPTGNVFVYVINKTETCKDHYSFETSVWSCSVVAVQWMTESIHQAITKYTS